MIVVCDAVNVVLYVGEELGDGLPVSETFSDPDSAPPVLQLLVQAMPISDRNTL